MEQQSLVNEQENQTYSEDDGEKSGNNGDETSQQQRTCFELKTANPWLTSGMHWIDPDGENSGDPPIHVHCDMETGKNQIFHLKISQVQSNFFAKRYVVHFARFGIDDQRDEKTRIIRDCTRVIWKRQIQFTTYTQFNNCADYCAVNKRIIKDLVDFVCHQLRK